MEGERDGAERGWDPRHRLSPRRPCQSTQSGYIPLVSFAVGADAYDRFMGRYSSPLAPRFADFADVDASQRVLDVGCGPGALTTELVRRLGPGTVSAVDPSEPFVAAVHERHPGVSVQRASAEDLPFDDQAFDAALAQLVVHFMADPVGGLREMARVTRTGGVVAACVWDHGGSRGPLNLFWRAARELDPDVEDESKLAGTREGHLARLFRGEGCTGSKRALSPSASNIRALRNGGNRSRSAWVPPAATRPVSTRAGKPSYGNGAARCCRPHRSC
jgi:SAM-dependent methyltransferase